MLILICLSSDDRIYQGERTKLDSSSPVKLEITFRISYRALCGVHT